MKTYFLPLAVIAAAAVALSQAGCAFETLDEHPCPTGGTTLTYENFGANFFRRYCNECHSAEIDERNGAPENYVFSSHESIVALKKRIFSRYSLSRMAGRVFVNCSI